MELAVIGRERDVSRAEIETVCASGGFEHFNDAISLLETQNSIDRFGGVVALGEVVVRDKHPAQPLVWAQDQICQILQKLPAQSGKITFGLSLYGDPKIASADLTRTGLTIKKALKQAGINSRLVLPKSTALSAAQLKFNRLVGRGQQFVICLNQAEIIIARVTEIQDIDWYSQRDYGRPCRDAKIGMLPPKLAQIMINLAAPAPSDLIVDPFCGSGVVLSEALLWGHPVFGSDIEAKMIDCSRQNLDWLADQRSGLPDIELQTADARQLKLPNPKNSVIVSEGYLGPVDSYPTAAQKDELTKLYQDFFGNIATQQSAGQRLVLCLPAWQRDNQIETLPILDQITDLGYNTKVFSGQSELIYRREQQRVGRQILTLIKKS